MADAPEIKVKLTAEDQGVAAAIKELGNQLKTLKTQQDAVASSARGLSSAFGTITAVVGTLKLAQFGKEAFDSAVNIGKMADKTGLTTQTLSVFHHVADEVGVSSEAVDKGITKAARSITALEQGTKPAIQSFALLGLTQKSFVGLNADQKILLVTNALGKMQAGLQKTAAAQLIFSRGGSEMILLANAIAAQGFDKLTASVSKLGLLLDQTTTDSFRAAKASMQELDDAAKGVATQFETGLLPAISDVADAMLESVDIGGKSGDGFREMGKTAGTVVRAIAAGFIWMGATLAAEIATTEEIFSEAFTEIKIRGVSVYGALTEAAKGHFKEAGQVFGQGSRDIAAAQGDLAKKQKAIWDDAAVHIRKSMEAINPSDAEEARRNKERIGRLRPDQQDETHPIVQDTAPTDAAAKARLSLLEKKLQDELTIHRAYAKQTEQVDAEMFAAGEISLAEYFDRRKVAVSADAAEEVAILRQSALAAKAEAERAAVAKTKAATPKDADRQEAVRLGALEKVEEYETKISEIQINAATKIQALSTEQTAKTIENETKVLGFQKQMDELQGKRVLADRQIIASEQEQYRVALQIKGVDSPAQIDAKVAAYGKEKLAVADFKDAETKLQEDERSFDIERRTIESREKAGLISRLNAERQINSLIKERLPSLQADAAAELTAAQSTGNQDNVAKAREDQQKLREIQLSAKDLGQQLGQGLNADFTHFFETVGRGTQSLARQFQGLAASIVQSVEQMLVKMLMLKIATAAAGASGGSSGFLGGLFSGLSGGQGHAEGGLIKGSGGPKSDSIPARVSPGEFIVKSDAVSAFGVHNLEAINRGMKIPSLANLAMPRFAEGGLVGSSSGSGNSNIQLGIGLDEGLILKHLASKDAGRIILQHLTNNPKAAHAALSRSA